MGTFSNNPEAPRKTTDSNLHVEVGPDGVVKNLTMDVASSVGTNTEIAGQALQEMKEKQEPKTHFERIWKNFEQASNDGKQAQDLLAQAAGMPEGPERDAVMSQARELESKAFMGFIKAILELLSRLFDGTLMDEMDKEKKDEGKGKDAVAEGSEGASVTDAVQTEIAETKPSSAAGVLAAGKSVRTQKEHDLLETNEELKDIDVQIDAAQKKRGDLDDKMDALRAKASDKKQAGKDSEKLEGKIRNLEEKIKKADQKIEDLIAKKHALEKKQKKQERIRDDAKRIETDMARVTPILDRMLQMLLKQLEGKQYRIVLENGKVAIEVEGPKRVQLLKGIGISVQGNLARVVAEAGMEAKLQKETPEQKWARAEEVWMKAKQEVAQHQTSIHKNPERQKAVQAVLDAMNAAQRSVEAVRGKRAYESAEALNRAIQDANAALRDIPEFTAIERIQPADFA